MKPIDPEIPTLQLRTYAKDQPQYIPLPARVTGSGRVITCWKLGWKERIRVLFSGKLFLSVLTFNQPLQPLKPEVNKPEIDNV